MTVGERAREMIRSCLQVCPAGFDVFLYLFLMIQFLMFVRCLCFALRFSFAQKSVHVCTRQVFSITYVWFSSQDGRLNMATVTLLYACVCSRSEKVYMCCCRLCFLSI